MINFFRVERSTNNHQIKHMKKLNRIITALAGLLSPRPIINMANAFPPKPDEAKGGEGGKPAPTPAPGQETPKGVAASDPGKGSSPDPGTGKTFDYRKMVLQLLGLGDEQDEAKITEAYNACMAMEPDEETKAVQGKLNETTIAKDEAEEEAKEAKAANEQLKKELETALLAANESTDAVARAERAEAAFANERNAHCRAIVNIAVAQGKLNKKQADEKYELLANAKTAEDFDKLTKQIANTQASFNTATSIGELNRTIAPGTASHEFKEMVNESMKADPKHDWSFHWAKVSKSEKGQSLLAQMKQPQGLDK